MAAQNNSKVERKRGAQVGNTNAVKHPWRVLFDRSVLKKQYAGLRSLMSEYRANLIADKGGPDNMSYAELAIVGTAERAFGCQLMILAEAGRRGLTLETAAGWDLHPGFRELSKYIQIELKALQTYGTKRRPKDLPTLQEYLETMQQTDDVGGEEAEQQTMKEENGHDEH